MEVVDEREGIRDPWMAVEAGLVDHDTLWAAYRSNLELVMEPVWRLVESLDGKTVVTSDHGNLIGERGWPVPMRLYGHPTGVRLPGLVRVPWATVEGERREIEGEETTDNLADDGVVAERLEDLGYR